MRAPRNARPSGGTSHNALVRTPGVPVKHGHHWRTGSAPRSCTAHTARTAQSDTTAYMALAKELGASYELATTTLARARRSAHRTGCAFTYALELLGA